MGIDISFLSSYALYFCSVLISVLFAWLSIVFPFRQKGIAKINPIFWSLSFFILWFVMGFREDIGVDYYTYQDMFERVLDLGYFGYYKSGYWTEPGYIFILYAIGVFGGDFKLVFICTSFIGLYFFYKSFCYYYPYVNPAWCVFVFSTLHYFYFFGIDRLFLAVSIVFNGIIFLLNGNLLKYLLFIVVASLFHLSALFMIFLPLIFRFIRTNYVNRSGYFSKRTLNLPLVRYYFFLFSLPGALYVLTIVIPYLPSKYHGYLENTEYEFVSIIFKIPIVILLLTTMSRSAKFHFSALLYHNLYILSVAVQSLLFIINLGRVGWYFWVSLGISFPLIIRAYSKNFAIKTLLVLIVVCYCIAYMMYAYLGVDSGRWLNMFPYKNIYFQL